MTWKVDFQDKARRELRQLDPPLQKRILRYLRDRIATDENPRRFGKPMSGRLGEYWRYRVGSYRLICEIFDEQHLVRVRKVGHRREVYR